MAYATVFSNNSFPRAACDFTISSQKYGERDEMMFEMKTQQRFCDLFFSIFQGGCRRFSLVPVMHVPCELPLCKLRWYYVVAITEQTKQRWPVS